jgi:hypothetical protein
MTTGLRSWLDERPMAGQDLEHRHQTDNLAGYLQVQHAECLATLESWLRSFASHQKPF